VSDASGPRPDGGELTSAVGAVIFASGEPVRASEVAEAFGGLAVEQVEQAIRALAELYDRHGAGLCIEPIAGGYRLATRSEVGGWVRRFLRQRNRARLSAAALETLAVIAYRQPVTAPEIQTIRGKDPTAALKGLLDKKLIRLLGRKKVVGSPLLYGTSKHFLVHFGLNSLEDLPSLEEFDEFVGGLEIWATAGDAVPAEGPGGDDSPDAPGDPAGDAARPG
jgi:segregation and condensation protein B